MPGLSPGILEVATGDEHSCALAASGQVECWGQNRSWELGHLTRQLDTVAIPIGLPEPGAGSGLAAGAVLLGLLRRRARYSASQARNAAPTAQV